MRGIGFGRSLAPRTARRGPLARLTARALLVTLPLTLLPAGLIAAPASASDARSAGASAPAADPSARPHPKASFPQPAPVTVAPEPPGRTPHAWLVARLALGWLKALVLKPMLLQGGGPPPVTRQHTFPAGWSLVSVPLQPADGSPGAVFDELPAPLRLYDYVGGHTLGVGEAGFRSVGPGRGFWLLLSAPHAVSATGSLLSATTPRTVPLVVGWNTVATPWLTPVEWTDARVSVRQGAETKTLADAVAAGWIDPDLTGLDGGVESTIQANASPAGELAPWGGYLLFSHVQGELVFTPPPPDTTPPTLSFEGLADGAEIAQPTAITGRVDDPNLVQWILETATGSTGAFTLLASGTGPVDGTLATLDPTTLENGMVRLRFTAFDAAGNGASVERTVLVTGENKVGLFQLTFRDLEVPVGGIPIAVNRVYDSRARGTRGNFGFGWRLEVEGRGKYTNNRKPGDGWHFSGSFLPCQNVAATKAHVTEVRFSDREVYRFALQAFAPAPTLGGCFASVRFVQTGGIPGAQLQILGLTDVFWASGTDALVELDNFEVYEPREVRLVTAAGRQFDLNLTSGLRRVADANGNSLTIGAGGITHSSGKGITFTRDGAGRIVRIADPAGNATTYAYDAAGDLASFTDREASVTAFTYSLAHPHLLEEVEDPLGRRAIRTEYDENGRLVSQTDAFGNTIEFTHDVEGRQQVVTDRLGNVRVLEYDERGNITRETDAAGNVTTRTFDTRGNRLTETNPLGQTTTFAYDASDNVLSERDPLGNVATFTYNSRNQRLTTTDARGKVTTNTYGATGNLTAVRDPLGNETRYTHDASGNVLTETDAAGAVTRFEYDGFGNPTKQIDALGRETTSTYDPNGNRLSETRTRVVGGTTETLTTTFAYDKLGRPVETTAPDGAVTRTTYDAVGNKATTVDALGRTTAFTYDELGQLTRTTLPDGTTEERTYDAEERQVTLKDRRGGITTFEYDALGRLTRTVYPDGRSVRRTYDGAGRAVTDTDPQGRVATSEYDAAGRRTKLRDALGNETLFAYDANGNQTAVTDPAGNTTTFEYDDLNRNVRVVFPDGTEERTTYDAMGRRTSATDQAARTTQFTYDGAGRLATIVDAAGEVTSFGYDEQGNRVSFTDAEGRVTRIDYDRAGRETKRTLPDGEFETRSYDAAGNVVAKTDFLGRTVTFEYDGSDRLLARDYPDGSSVRFAYDAGGRRTSATDGGGVTTYTWDARDRLASLTYPDGRRLEYAYDANGNRTGLTARVGTLSLAATYAYDALGRLDVATDPLGRTYDHGYDAAGNRASLAYPNGVTTAYTYDRLGRLSRLATTDTLAATIQSYAYTLGPAGHRTRVEEQDGTLREHGYDLLHRLTNERVTHGGVPEYEKSLTYDAVGNRLTQQTSGTGSPGSPTGPGTFAYSYDSRDRLLGDGVTAYGYDDNGNLVTRSAEADYTWDFDDRLVRVVKADGTLVEHAYDADGNRVRTSVTPANGPPATTQLLVDPSGPLSHVVAETDGAGTLQAYYVRGHEVLAVMRPDAGSPGGWQTRFLHADGAASVRYLTDESGEVTDAYEYTAFGERVAHTGTDPQPYGFAGEPFEAASAAAYHRARWLDARLGRFLSVDPLLLAPLADDAADPVPFGLHPYTYANGDPVNFVDPSGLFGFSIGSISISINVSNTLRANNSVAAHAARSRILAQLGRIPFQSVRAMRALRQAGQQTHHIIERRIWNRVPELQRLWRHVDDMPGVNLTPQQHQVFTNRWLAEFGRSNMRNFNARPTLEQVMKAAERVYHDHPELLKPILRDLLPYIL